MYKDTHEVIIYNAQTTENRLNTKVKWMNYGIFRHCSAISFQRAYIDMGKYESVKAVYLKILIIYTYTERCSI